MRSLPPLSVQSPAWSSLPALQKSGRVLAAGADEKVRAYHRDTAELLWESSLESESTKLLVNDGFVVSQGQDSLQALDLKSGQSLWNHEGREQLLALSDEVVLTEEREGIQALHLDSGEMAWSAEKNGPASYHQGRVYSVKEESQGIETLEARSLQNGELRWRATDGEIEHLLSHSDGVFYSSVKIGAHNEKVTYLSSRGLDGNSRWTHRCEDALRGKPSLSGDGSRLALTMLKPGDRSRSVVSVLDTQTGRELFQVEAALKCEIAFLKNGSVALAEQEFSEVPGEGVTRHRVLDSQGRELWRRSGQPEWMVGGETLAVYSEGSLRRLDVSTGETLWSRPVGGKAAPLAVQDERLSITVDGCRLEVLSLRDGAVEKMVSTGHKLLLSEGEGNLLTDHEGRVWTETLPSGGTEFFSGTWERPEPFHIPFLAGPAQRGGREAVFVDWDGDERDLGEDPVLVDSAGRIVSPQELRGRDEDHDGTLTTPQLRDLSLWFDMDDDGRVSSERELTPLIDGASFDKAKFEFPRERLWLAAESRCSDHG